MRHGKLAACKKKGLKPSNGSQISDAYQISAFCYAREVMLTALAVTPALPNAGITKQLSICAAHQGPTMSGSTARVIRRRWGDREIPQPVPMHRSLMQIADIPLSMIASHHLVGSLR